MLSCLLNAHGQSSSLWQMSLLEAEKVELVKFRDISELEKEQLLGQVCCQYSLWKRVLAGDCHSTVTEHRALKPNTLSLIPDGSNVLSCPCSIDSGYDTELITE